MQTISDAEAIAASSVHPGEFALIFDRHFDAIQASRESWLPGMPVSGNLASGAFVAMLPIETETWAAPDGGGRVREMRGEVSFLTEAERERWLAAGSPPPPAMRGSRSARLAPGDLPCLGADLPSDPRALRRVVEERRFGATTPPGTAAYNPLDGLAAVLTDVCATPELRAAAFLAAGEVNGVTLGGWTKDSIGRRGLALRYDGAGGTRTELIFSPSTSDVLVQRLVLVSPEEAGAEYAKIPPGTLLGSRLFLQAVVVESISARPRSGI